MTIEEAKQQKARALEALCRESRLAAERLREVDERLWLYIYGCTDGTYHCTSEILCALKFLRVFNTYELDIKRVQTIYRMYEGRWEQTESGWKYIPHSGGLQFSSLQGRDYYRLQPFQLFILTWIFGFYHLVKLNTKVGERELQETEVAGSDGYIYDRRRLVTEAVIYIPRKAGKTTLGAFIQFVMFFLGDANGEIFCASNTQSQSKIIFGMVSDLIHQLDPQERRIRFTASCLNWKRGQARTSKVEALTAGGKAKDGANPLSVASDEFGQAEWTKEHCDMVDLLNVLYSGMGVRREPLVTHTTTAGHAINGPFFHKLEGIKEMLAKELEDTTNTDADFQACILLEPDEWERDEEILFNDERIWRKVNPMIGVSVQPNFYREEIARSLLDPNKKKETVTKLFNVFATERIKEWEITPDKARRLQVDRKITDCLYRNGWSTFVGLDFSGGEDLFAITYFAVNYSKGIPMSERFFADTEAWIIETELKRSPNQRLYELWIEQGWLHVCPGEVFKPELAINKLMEKHQMGVNLAMFGYDPAQSKDPINIIKAWLQSLGIDAATIKSMVVPVAQNFLTMNPLIQKLEYYMLGTDPYLRLSNNPLWAWQFGNAKIETAYDKTLRKILKAGADKKVDSIHALLDACYCFDMSEGRV